MELWMMKMLTRRRFGSVRQHGVPPALRRWFVSPVFLLLAGLQMASASDTLIERGRYIFTAAGCASCHTHDQALAGGRPLDTPFGTFYPPNISPDREQGIGNWSEADFMRALGEGVSPEGEHYYPAFPYTSYTRMTRADMQALYAYLMTQQPVARASRAHDLPWFLSSRKLLGFWKGGRFTPGSYQYDPGRPADWNRGAYLAQALGHCGECHTPRGLLGGVRGNRYLAGTRSGPEGKAVPNITQDRKTGIGGWSPEEQRAFLASGRLPDGAYTGPLMAEVLGSSSMSLTAADRQALATYLQTLPPIHHDIHYRFDPFADRQLRE
jgi:mono/diheme cytochrome c family protein